MRDLRQPGLAAMRNPPGAVSGRSGVEMASRAPIGHWLDITPTRIGTLGGMSTSEDANLLTVPEVAAHLNVSRSTAWRLVYSGELPRSVFPSLGAGCGDSHTKKNWARGVTDTIAFDEGRAPGAGVASKKRKALRTPLRVFFPPRMECESSLPDERPQSWEFHWARGAGALSSSRRLPSPLGKGI
jgi:Helix-turn-helix domain